MAPLQNQVAEMQGLYGPFTVAERVVQKIWLRGDFARDRAVLADGRKLEIRSTGAWNLLGGPDFRGARLAIDGRETTGDIEVHFHAADWRAHGHAADRAYDNVALHVVLFPPGAFERPAIAADGRELPTLVLLPLLHRDLEEYASDDALETITARDEWERFAELAATPPGQLHPLLRKKAGERWRQKVRFAQLRLEKLGWTAAAHQLALEILGYRQNRAAMLGIAAQYPLEVWPGRADPRAIFDEHRPRLQLQGVRPGNHPLTRLRQYQAWVIANPNWPERLTGMMADLDWRGGGGAADRVRETENIQIGAAASRLPERGEGAATTKARQSLGLKRLREAFARELVHDAIGGTRLDNLICDGFLPLVAARTGGDQRLFAGWFHWYLGDVPAALRQAPPKLGVTGIPGQPLCHGWAQGLLGWLLEREARASN
ncbi:MAG: hypothetical protein JWQ62_1157 [Lacunisphaera sp.]|nr:hypothetical protein [Lacunisphaera sp.]